MQSLGAVVIYPVRLPQPSELTMGDDYTPFIVNCMCIPCSPGLRYHCQWLLTLHTHIAYEHQETANEFFREFVEPGSQVHDLASVVEFNKEHAEKCMPKGNLSTNRTILRVIKF